MKIGDQMCVLDQRSPTSFRTLDHKPQFLTRYDKMNNEMLLPTSGNGK